MPTVVRTVAKSCHITRPALNKHKSLRTLLEQKLTGIDPPRRGSKRSGNIFRRAPGSSKLRPRNLIRASRDHINLPYWTAPGSPVDPRRGAPEDHEKVKRPTRDDARG